MSDCEAGQFPRASKADLTVFDPGAVRWLCYSAGPHGQLVMVLGRAPAPEEVPDEDYLGRRLEEDWDALEPTEEVGG